MRDYKVYSYDIVYRTNLQASTCRIRRRGLWSPKSKEVCSCPTAVAEFATLGQHRATPSTTISHSEFSSRENARRRCPRSGSLIDQRPRCRRFRYWLQLIPYRVFRLCCNSIHSSPRLWAQSVLERNLFTISRVALLRDAA